MEKERMLMGRKVICMNGLMGNDKKVLLNKLLEKMKDFLRPETASKVIKIWEDVAALYTHVSNCSPTEFWMQAK